MNYLSYAKPPTAESRGTLHLKRALGERRKTPETVVGGIEKLETEQKWAGAELHEATPMHRHTVPKKSLQAFTM
jgi:hypothetical protein